jgi:hypothetical protein
MEEKVSCTCQTPGCTECLPDCTVPERNRWITALETLTGTYQDYACTKIDRTDSSTRLFDLGYFMPHFMPSGSQANDGLLDAYQTRLRFGMATFDGWDTYVGQPPLVSISDFDFDKSAGVEGLWSYNPERALQQSALYDGHPTGDFRYPNEPTNYQMDTGVRGPQASEGALVIASDPAHALEVNTSLQVALRQVWPYGGTPIAAALDDLYYFLGRDPKAAPERALSAPKYVVLITDGYPDLDYHDYGCDCATTQSPSDPSYCGGGPPNDPALMHCPYPTPEDAARRLHCPAGATCDPGAVRQLYVVSYAVQDATVQTKLDAIASAGGTGSARLAPDGDGLRRELTAIFDQVLSAP